MTTADGNVVGTTLIKGNGSSDRWTLVLMGDGYTNTELGTFSDDVQNFVNTLINTRPFNVLRSGLDVFRIDVSSTDSGADDPASCGGTGATARTYFDSMFCAGGIRRALTIDNNTAITLANNSVPQWDMIMVIVNSTIYGGTGGNVAVFSKAPNAMEIALHEMGHTAFHFADEYEYYQGCGSGETTQNSYAGTEPAQPNVTIEINRSNIKWRQFILATTAVPTTRNSNCSVCDPQTNPVPAGTVGLYEGAYYNHCGAFRPEFDCRMRALGNEFCAVCENEIRIALYPYATWEPVKPSQLFQNHAPNNNNFELFVGEGKKTRHHWFDYANARWNVGDLLGLNRTSDPVVFQNHAPNNNNFELFVGEGKKTRHHWFDYANARWNVGDLLGSNRTSDPVVFQNHAPNNNNFELFVGEGKKTRHHWFDYANARWNVGDLLGLNRTSDPVVFQNHAPNNNNFELFVGEGKKTRHHWFDYANARWNVGDLLGSNRTSDPVVFQNHAPNNNNFELFVGEGKKTRHHWFDYANARWNVGDLLGSNRYFRSCGIPKSCT